MNLELVVARHRENLNWLRRVPKKFRVTIYDKGGHHDAKHPLPNVGREAHTYLHHIVTRYDDLAELTVFAQGKPFDHVSTFHAILRELAAGNGLPATHAHFRWLGFIQGVLWDEGVQSIEEAEKQNTPTDATFDESPRDISEMMDVENK